jgi:hypothetical protein
MNIPASPPDYCFHGYKKMRFRALHLTVKKETASLSETVSFLLMISDSMLHSFNHQQWRIGVK